MSLIKTILLGFLIYFVVAFLGTGLLAIIYIGRCNRSEQEQAKLDDEQMEAVSKIKK
jgi:hypothetical protein